MDPASDGWGSEWWRLRVVCGGRVTPLLANGRKSPDPFRSPKLSPPCPSSQDTRDEPDHHHHDGYDIIHLRGPGNNVRCPGH